MKKYSKKSLVSSLQREGQVFSEFTLTHEGDYAVDDADWNYKDVPHLHYVHELAEAIPAVVGDDLIATINMQKVLMFRFPFALFNFEFEKNTQVYYTTWLWLILIIETAYEALGPCKTRVNTTYSVGGPPWLKWTFPIIKWVLKRNYDNLMSTDIPMRQRKGQLRKWGYSFSKRLANYSFEDTMDIAPSNVVLPADQETPQPVLVNILEALPADGEYLLGKDDHLGLRIVRASNKLHIFPRMCPHEGASLDGQSCKNGRIHCPWHGRAFDPLAQFDLAVGRAQEATTASHWVSLDGGRLEVSFLC